MILPVVSPPKKVDAKYDVSKIGNRNIGAGLDFYSTDKEIALGRELSKEIENSVRLVKDPVITCRDGQWHMWATVHPLADPDETAAVAAKSPVTVNRTVSAVFLIWDWKVPVSVPEVKEGVGTSRGRTSGPSSSGP